ncbi:VWA domain-containing protein [Clostridium algidicarnis]|uniref:vWA domain-containing protein n=1 Tax=Clostridium algidicarnis TaxID=37659 RepID=UPI001C0BA9E8|nr:VWA domain-containing protein [Clostridium algidicarnis]MBU3209476.1 VWA domain-containing protein [Clostridium algidicarnis]
MTRLQVVKAISIFLIMTLVIMGTNTSIQTKALENNESIEVYKKSKLLSPCNREYEVELNIKGKLQNIKPVDTVLVIDRSGSMDESRFKNAKDAAKEFSKKIILDNPNNSVSIVSFSDEAIVNLGLKNDLKTINKTIDNLRASGNTNIYDGLVKANSVLNGANRDSVKSIVLLSDGIANRPWNGYSNYPMQKSIDEAGKSKKNNYLLFTVGLFSGMLNPDKETAVNTLTSIANKGNYYDSSSEDKLTEIYLKIANLINFAAKEVVVTDVLSKTVRENFDLNLGSFKIDGVAVKLGGAENRILFDAKTGTISWNLGTIGEETKTLTYVIKANSSYEGSNGEFVYTNENAKVKYQDTLGNSKEKLFPVPYIKVPGILTAIAGDDMTIYEGDSIVLGVNPTAKGGFGSEINWTTLEDKTVTWDKDNLNTTGEYSYKWSSRNPGESTWIEFSSLQNPKVNPSNSTEYRLEVKDTFGKCIATDEVTMTVKRVGEVKVKVMVLDEDDKDISDSIIDEFYLKAEGINNQKWNIIMGPKEIKAYKGLELGDYSIVPDYISKYYKLISIKDISGNDITSKGKITLSNENRKEEVIVTLKVNKTGGFTDKDIKDNEFPVIK